MQTVAGGPITSLKKNLAYNITYQLLIIILPLITAPYVSRVLGVDGVGRFSYIYSIAFYFGMFGMLGISNHGNRSIALSKNDPNRTSAVFSNIYCIQFCTTSIVFVLYILFVSFLFNGNKTVAYIDSLYVLATMLDINWLFFGLEKFKLTVTRNLLFKLGTIVCIFIFVKNTSDLWKYTLILALGTTISQVYLWFYVRKYVHLTRPNLNEIKKHIMPIFALFIPVIAYSIYKVMDKIMLGSITNMTQVGLFENSEKIVGIPVGIITAFGTVMMPRISSLIADKNPSQIDIYNRLSFKYFTFIALGMVFGLVGISNVLPSVYFGEEFADCSRLIAGLSFTLIFMTWANIIRTQYLIPNKNDKPYIVSTVVGAAVIIVVNLILIPRFQAVGALVGTLIAEFLVFFIQMMYVRKEFPVLNYLKNGIAFFPIGVFMCIVVHLIGTKMRLSLITLVVQICVGGVLYLLLSLIYFLATKDEIVNAILMIIRKQRVFGKNT